MKNIRVDTSRARDEQSAKAINILDRLVRTLKDMIGKYRTKIVKRTSFSDILDRVIYTYKNQVHRTIKSTPDDMFKNIDKQNFNFEKDKKNIIEI